MYDFMKSNSHSSSITKYMPYIFYFNVTFIRKPHFRWRKKSLILSKAPQIIKYSMPEKDEDMRGNTEQWSNIARFIAKDIDIGLNGKVGYSLINCPSYLRINSTGHVTMLSRAMKMLNLASLSCQGRSSYRLFCKVPNVYGLIHEKYTVRYPYVVGKLRCWRQTSLVTSLRWR